ncbi:hypothetical protein RGQ29_004488 [Quercus rubra]|uniref:Ketoreductase domain-containing protein n=1 Tax=Quercus rubra TaxID=3512 RepID=A0AAN7EFA8_QUERU|nr:hypothetical protein RGQ29_004488 [Quercus rubra]
MDLLHKFLNIAVPLLMLIAFPFFMPPFLLLKFLSFLKRSIYSEKVSGKVVLVTGASSGIGKHVAYEYARRGARLALVDIRDDRLPTVANKARELGSPEVIVVRADVSKVEECKQFVDETVNYFGRLDHLVNNAGVISGSFFENYTKFTDVSSIMDVNFWGSVYGTHYAVPHLRKSKGKIVVMASTGASITMPRISFYNASKAALISFFETLRTEIGSNIGITIVTPGLIDSEITRGPSIQEGKISWVPVESTERCAKAIVDSTCRGDMYLTVPSWMGWGFWTRVLCPEVLEWGLHAILVKCHTLKRRTCSSKIKVLSQ